MRWLAIAVSDNGDVKTAMVDDTTGTALPYGDHSGIIDRMGSDVDSLTALVQMPDGDFRPEIVDTTTDSEAPMVFLDL